MRRLWLAVSLCLSVLIGCALFGRLSDNTMAEEQNMLGGIGLISTTSRSRSVIYPKLYDKRNVYFDIQDSMTNEFYSMDINSGDIRPVCSRPMCDHTVSECPLSRLYKTGFLSYFAVDNSLYYYDKTDDKLLLYEWDVMSDKDTKVCEFPAEITVKDEQGTKVRIKTGISCVERINADTLFVHSGMTGYVFGNSFELISRFDCGSGIEFAFTDDSIYYMQGTDFCRYSLAENKLYDKILEAAGVTSAPSSYSYYGYNGKLWFFSENHICSYSPDDNKITEELSALVSMGFKIIGQKLYYGDEHGSVCALDLQSGRSDVIEGLNTIPTDEINGRLLIYTDDSYELWGGE